MWILYDRESEEAIGPFATETDAEAHAESLMESEDMSWDDEDCNFSVLRLVSPES